MASVQSIPSLPTGPGTADARTLLYVEDNEASRMLVESLLERRPDVRLLTADDGMSGVEIALATQPNVILMDIHMPGISGFEALKILEGDPMTAHIPVIALSSSSSAQDVVKGMDAGFFRYLTKPIRVNEFLDTLDEAIKFSNAFANHVQKSEKS